MTVYPEQAPAAALLKSAALTPAITFVEVENSFEISAGAVAVATGFWQILIEADTVLVVTLPQESVHLTSTVCWAIPALEDEAVQAMKLAGTVVLRLNPDGTVAVDPGVWTNEQAACGTKVALALLNLVWRSEKARTF